MIFTIKKNSHYSNQLLYKLVNLFHCTSKLEYTVKFDSSCAYKLDASNEQDINKLFGFSIGMHHTNSARFGWNWDAYNESIRIYSYCYVNGDRDTSYICSLKLEGTYRLSILDEGSHYLFKVLNAKTGVVNYSVIKKQYTSGFGYRLWPYFGGDCKAPHDIKINIKQ